jgi:hypothetical protein
MTVLLPSKAIKAIKDAVPSADFYDFYGLSRLLGRVQKNLRVSAEPLLFVGITNEPMSGWLFWGYVNDVTKGRFQRHRRLLYVSYRLSQLLQLS